MSPLPAVAIHPEISIPTDVREFALQQGVTAYLPTVLDVARRTLPEASISLVLETDPEIEDVRHVVVLAHGVRRNVEQSLAVYDEWHRELFAAIPAPFVCVFRLGLEYAS